MDRGPRSLQPTAELRKLSRGGHGGRRAEPGLPGTVLWCSGLAESAGRVCSSRLLGGEGTSEGLRGWLAPACSDLLGRERTPLRGP